MTNETNGVLTPEEINALQTGVDMSSDIVINHAEKEKII